VCDGDGDGLYRAAQSFLANEIAQSKNFIDALKYDVANCRSLVHDIDNDDGAFLMVLLLSRARATRIPALSNSEPFLLCQTTTLTFTNDAGAGAGAGSDTDRGATAGASRVQAGSSPRTGRASSAS